MRQEQGCFLSTWALWNRILKWPCRYSSKNWPVFYGTGKSMIVFIITCHRARSSGVIFRSILILSSRCVGVRKCRLLSDFPVIEYVACTTYPSHCVRFGLVALQEYKLRVWSFLVCSIRHPCYFVTLRCRYSPQHPIVKHLESLFFPCVQGASAARCNASNTVVLQTEVNTFLYPRCVLCIFTNLLALLFVYCCTLLNV
jgi:hypothetical protein